MCLDKFRKRGLAGVVGANDWVDGVAVVNVMLNCSHSPSEEAFYPMVSQVWSGACVSNVHRLMWFVATGKCGGFVGVVVDPFSRFRVGFLV